MLVTALSPVIGSDKASKIAHYAMNNDLTLKAAALKLGFVTEVEFDRVVDPKKMVTPYVAAPTTAANEAASTFGPTRLIKSKIENDGERRCQPTSVE
jgi:fumarate hydratase class II